MDNLKIRISRDPNDIDLVLKVASSFGGNEDQLKGIRQYLLNELKDLGEKRVLFILSSTSEPIGVVQLLIGDDGKEGHIHALQVDKKFHRCGHGLKLMHALEEHSKNIGIERLTLSVDEDNTKAVPLYTNLGYELLENEIKFKKNIKVLKYIKSFIE
jgi:ribosomal protein S18 acetylase RimI-like enzyme